MLQIIPKIPFFVWPIFTVLLLAGLRARKPNAVPLYTLLLLPAIFLVWSFISFFEKYEGPQAAIFWALSLATGFFLGFSHIQKTPLQFDKQKRAVLMPGSWIPLILSMSIFFSKFSIGILNGIYPHLNGSNLFLCIELFTALITGIFAGRGLACLLKYRAAPSAETI
jgi:hypothetical protein